MAVSKLDVPAKVASLAETETGLSVVAVWSAATEEPVEADSSVALEALVVAAASAATEEPVEAASSVALDALVAAAASAAMGVPDLVAGSVESGPADSMADNSKQVASSVGKD
ncbi:hypothetical protein [Brevibacillus reuszeri]|uniref:hypothetical protein n=1 Tax=Brevibacillus reuszeri TaxID=54915 RepID=UPI001F19106D|nr:hypothetical protein [Brevibacillus reuszeri]MED1859928.1 hypothetical protein [Brevibacillus reuszeri]